MEVLGAGHTCALYMHSVDASNVLQRSRSTVCEYLYVQEEQKTRRWHERARVCVWVGHTVVYKTLREGAVK